MLIQTMSLSSDRDGLVIHFGYDPYKAKTVHENKHQPQPQPQPHTVCLFLDESWYSQRRGTLAFIAELSERWKTRVEESLRHF